MNLGAVVVPALVGYWILRQTHYFKPAVAQTPSYAFAFFSASIGVLAGAVALALTRLFHVLTRVEPAAWYPWWQAQLSFEDPSTVFVMILLAVTTSGVVNRLITERDVARKWVIPDESRVGRLLRESVEKQRLVEVVTLSRDSYVGLVEGGRYPWEWGEDIAIVPIAVGYRDEETRRLVLTGIRPKGVQLSEGNIVAVPRSSVVSVTMFTTGGIAPPRRVTRATGSSTSGS